MRGFLLVFFPFILHFDLVAASRECEYSLRVIPGFDPIVQQDSNGLKCRGRVELPLCRGYCKTSESGTHGFPPRVQKSYACSLVKTSTRVVRLTDCDEGAAEEIRSIEIPFGTECECRKLPLDHA